MFATAAESRFPPLGNTFLNWVPASPRIERRSRSYSGFASYPRSADAPNRCEEDGTQLHVDTHESYSTAEASISLDSEQYSPRSGESTRCSSADVNDSSSEASLLDPSRGQIGEPVPATPVAHDELVTTLMIRNLPGLVGQKDVMAKLDASGFRDLYDFIYVPANFGKSRNKGYAFINLMTAEAASSLMKSWQSTRIFGMGSQSLDVSPGHVQGLEANVAAWGSGKKERIKNKLYRPWVRKTSNDESISSTPVSSRSGGPQASASPQKTHSKCRRSVRTFQQEQERSNCAPTAHGEEYWKILATVPINAVGTINNFP